MNAEKFAYWLQGFAELNEYPPNVEQWQAIRDHLALVFEKVTPDSPLAYQPEVNRQLSQWEMALGKMAAASGPIKATC